MLVSSAKSKHSANSVALGRSLVYKVGNIRGLILNPEEPALNNPFDETGLIELDKLFPIRKIAFDP
jgi:hypothetical protein